MFFRCVPFTIQNKDVFTERELIDMGYLISREYGDEIGISYPNFNRWINRLSGGFPIIVCCSKQKYADGSIGYGWLIVSKKEILEGTDFRKKDIYSAPIKLDRFEAVYQVRGTLGVPETKAHAMLNGVNASNNAELLYAACKSNDFTDRYAYNEATTELLNKLVRSVKLLK